jgi:putative endonuclease
MRAADHPTPAHARRAAPQRPDQVELPPADPAGTPTPPRPPARPTRAATGRKVSRAAKATARVAEQQLELRTEEERSLEERSVKARRARKAVKAAARAGDQQLDLGGPEGGSAGDEADKAGRRVEKAGRPRSYRQRLGALGEERAAEWYRDGGYEVVARNWRCHEGEIDLVAVGRGCVVICEVKTRSSDRFGVPAEAVTPAKQARLRGLAAQFLRERPQALQRLRFDVASVRSGKVDVIEGAF